MLHTDVLIVGCGCAGLYCALHLSEELNITIITKSSSEKSDSFLAQGGICVLRDEADYASFFEDTMRAGHYENNTESVSVMIRSSQDVISDLVSYGVDFAKNTDGTFRYTKEGAHSGPRILYHRDVTGKEITSKLLSQVQQRKNITLLEHTTLLDIVTDADNVCVGGVIALADGKIKTVSAGYTVLASGGIGGLYRHSTNFRHLTGDGIAIAIKHGIALKDIGYVQIHPTTLYTKDESERSFLISESVRGEGAKLYNKDKARFVDELLPRDLLTAAILEQMQKDDEDFVWEDLRTIPKSELEVHFPNIVKHCKDKNYDVLAECIPVVPAQHYFMGGIQIDCDGKTSMPGLYAVGETACNGVHGRNRLASNSLLESLVFAKRAAQDIKKKPKTPENMPEVDVSCYEDRQKLEETYRKLVLDEIDRANQREKGELYV